MMKGRIVILSFLSLLLLGADGCIRIGGTSGSNRDGGIFRSDEAGKTWGQVNFAGKDAKGRDIRLNNHSVLALVQDPQHPEVFYWGTGTNGILKTDNGGLEWKSTGLQTGGYRVIAVDPKNSDILYAATGGVIRKSTDAAQTWTVVYTETRPGQSITNLAIDFFSTNALYATTSDGAVIRSTDFATTWSLIAQMQTPVQKLLFHPKDSRILFARTDIRGLLVSRDSARTWQPLSDSLTQLPGSHPAFDLDILPQNPDRMYLATARGLLQSQDGGTTWSDVTTLIPTGTVPIQHVEIHPTNSSTIYFIAQNKLHTTVDGGRQWTVNPLPTSRPITVFFLNPQRPEQLFFSTLQVKR